MRGPELALLFLLVLALAWVAPDALAWLLPLCMACAIAAGSKATGADEREMGGD
jgi:hypothetical protein